MDVREILFAQFPAFFLLSVLFLAAHLRVRKRSAVKSVLWVLLFGAALAVSILFCILGIQAKYWTIKTLFELKFWSWLGVAIVVLVLVLRLVTAFLFWSAAYALYARSAYGLTWEDTLFRFLKGHYHMWFLFMIVGLYLLIPLLRRIAEDRALTKYFLALSLLFTFLLPQIASLLTLTGGKFSAVFSAVLGKFFFYFTLGFTAYFVGGFYLNRAELPQRTETGLMLLGVLGFVLTLVLSWRASVIAGAATERFYGYNTVGVLLTSTAVFLFSKRRLGFPKLGEKGRAAIRALSRWSFGAYLIHPMVIETLNLQWGLNTLSCNAFFSVPLLTLLVGTLSFLLSALLHQIPVVKKYIV